MGFPVNENGTLDYTTAAPAPTRLTDGRAEYAAPSEAGMAKALEFSEWAEQQESFETEEEVSASIFFLGTLFDRAIAEERERIKKGLDTVLACAPLEEQHACCMDVVDGWDGES